MQRGRCMWLIHRTSRSVMMTPVFKIRNDITYVCDSVNPVSSDDKLWQLKGQFAQTFKFCHYFLTLMSKPHWTPLTVIVWKKTLRHIFTYISPSVFHRIKNINTGLWQNLYFYALIWMSLDKPAYIRCIASIEINYMYYAVKYLTL